MFIWSNLINSDPSPVSLGVWFTCLSALGQTNLPTLGLVSWLINTICFLLGFLPVSQREGSLWNLWRISCKPRGKYQFHPRLLILIPSWNSHQRGLATFTSSERSKADYLLVFVINTLLWFCAQHCLLIRDTIASLINADLFSSNWIIILYFYNFYWNIEVGMQLTVEFRLF